MIIIIIIGENNKTKDDEKIDQQPWRDQKIEHQRGSEDERQNSWRHGTTSSDANTGDFRSNTSNR